jgi:hypothetical protein
MRNDIERHRRNKMGRPLNKKYFGNRNVGTSSTTADDGIGGKGVASVTIAVNNSSGYTNGSTTQAVFSAPTTPGGVTATGTIVTHSVGALTDKTTFTASGTGVTAAATYGSASAPLASTSAQSGTGATFIVTKTSGTAYSSTITVTVVDPGAGYALTNTIKILGSALGGADVTNDLTLTVATFVTATGAIKSITITDQGSGYTAAPTITLNTGTQGTTTLTPVLTATSVIASSTTGSEPAIIAYAGATNALADIAKQVAKDRYKVTTNGSTFFIAKLKTSAAASASDEMTITATDSLGKTYYVQKLTARKAMIVPYGTNGHEFPLLADGVAQQAPWSFATAVTGVVKIANG